MKVLLINKKVCNTTFNMETLLTNVYTGLDQTSKQLKTNQMASGMKELLQTKIYIKKHFSFF